MIDLGDCTVFVHNYDADNKLHRCTIKTIGGALSGVACVDLMLNESSDADPLQFIGQTKHFDNMYVCVAQADGEKP